jgi:hypothetical protein
VADEPGAPPPPVRAPPLATRRAPDRSDRRRPDGSGAWAEWRCPGCGALNLRLQLTRGSRLELCCRRCGVRYVVEAV